MSGLKTLCLALLCCGSGFAARADDSFLAHVATCVGRFSAQMEHHWLFQDTPTTRIETERAHLIDILEAVTTPENASDVLSMRIEAKLAHAALLTRAVFATQGKSSALATARVDTQLQACGDILLGVPPSNAPDQVSMSHVQSDAKLVNQRAIQETRTE